MKRTELFTKTSKTVPADETALNAKLLIRAGYVHKEMAGVYAYLPLGLRVMEKIKQIVREEMNSIGGQELLMTNLQPRALWETTRRWDDAIVDIWFKTKMQSGEELGLAWSHEEPIMNMLQNYVHSYKDLPVAVYQFQTKLRNELRAKSGVMRGREFLMKDMYSVHATKEDLDRFYQDTMDAYMRVYQRLGIGDLTYVTFASGGAFTKFSHEFQTICEAGEDWLYLDRERNVAVNEEVLDDAVQELGLDKNKLEKIRCAEVGNIFNFGTDKAEQMGITFADKDNTQKPFWYGSYGIGITRLIGVIAELFSDDKGLVWPDNIAPFRVYLMSIGEDEKTLAKVQEIYQQLQDNGIEVLWDDRAGIRPGEKFADGDLMGIPHRVVVNGDTLKSGKIEYKARTSDDTQLMAVDELLKKL
ncbi:MAG: His/Gly/Thr/Pro-type tRNA ligase C-terminal domain-containing protein [Candidatus Saccharibacteria bacterium]|nr:His/Gly/Thr/Pro-type tRNA ligase C-terminal domain-containing protein [Candidatus Saccharibacteria bacterium]